jgi:hypothetical protein
MFHLLKRDVFGIVLLFYKKTNHPFGERMVCLARWEAGVPYQPGV